MKGSIGLEHIGHDSHATLSSFKAFERLMGVKPDSDEPSCYGPAVAEIYRDEDGVLRRHLLAGKRDYSCANSKGSRGIYMWFTLQGDRLYWVRDPQSWRRVDTYYAALRLDGSVYRMNEEEAREWLNAL